MIKPLEIKSTLSSPTVLVPKYSIGVKSQRGRTFHLSHPHLMRIALALMDMQAVLGGAASHWGGPSGFIEIISALFGLIFDKANQKKCDWHSLFHVINDAGHCENGLYVLRANYGIGGLSFQDLKGFRSIDSPLAGHGEAHLFPQGVYLSNGPLGSTLAQAQGLCMADRLSGSHRVTVVLISDGACMEGEAKEALASIAGLSQKNQLNPFLLIVSDNNTKLSGRIDQDSFSMDPTMQSLSALGWQLTVLDKAHCLSSCVNTFEEILLKMLDPASYSQPICIRAKTIKGYGVQATQKASHGGHGFPLKDPRKLSDFLKEICGDISLPLEFAEWLKELESYSQTPKTENSGQKKCKVQEGISRALIRAGDNEWPVVSISADLQGSTGVLPFRKKFPNLSFEVGVAEANMISVAAGFSKQGFIPVVDTFTQFGVTKGALPLLMANLSQAPVIALFSHAGLQDAADGASHQSLTYLSQTSALPLTDVYCLTSSEEAFALLYQAIQWFSSMRNKNQVPRTQVFFFGRETFPSSYLPLSYSYQLGKAQIVFSGLSSSSKKAVTLLAAGPLLEQAIKAGHHLHNQGWTVEVINPSIINHPDIETLSKSLQKTNHQLLTIEDHYLIGGMGSQVAHQLSLKKISVDLRCLAIRSAFGRSAYRSSHLYQREQLSSQNIISAVQKYWS